MALKKPTTFKGTTAEYFSVQALRWNASTKEASALVSLFVNAQHREKSKGNLSKQQAPVDTVVAKIRLNGADFDRFVPPNSNPVAGFYVAAKAGVGVVSDLGKDFFTDAEDV